MDRTAHLLGRGYRFNQDIRAGHAHSPVPLRLLGSPALLVRGAQGVAAFYDTAKVQRAGAMPLPVRGPLFGQGAVHTLDDEKHRHRKALFVGLAYDDARVPQMLDLVEAQWRAALERLGADGADVYDTAVLAYGRGAIRWAGLALPESEEDTLARRLAQIVDGFGKLSAAHALAWINRARCDRRIASIIEDVRKGRVQAPEKSPLRVVVDHVDLDGTPLDARTASVELQNMIRPTIAVSRFAAFAAASLHENPQWIEQIRRETAERGTLVGGPVATAVAEEVRRVYPFVPMLPAIARHDFHYDGHEVRQGSRLLIDVVGTNRDERHWENPSTFDPRRFLGRSREEIEADPHFIPQGGGDVRTGHRCPGEKIAVGVLTISVAALCEPGVAIDPDGLDFDTTTLPTRPAAARIRRA